jgi:ABC-type sugar transport system ATPase subunit
MPLTKVQKDGLSANQAISLVRVIETANVFETAIGGNVNIDVSNNTVYYFSANTTADVTFNLRANASHSLGGTVGIGQTISLALAVNHGTQRHTANVYIDGQAQTMYYFANTKPNSVPIFQQEINLFSYSIIRTGPSSYTVLAGNTLFGLG